MASSRASRATIRLGGCSACNGTRKSSRPRRNPGTDVCSSRSPTPVARASAQHPLPFHSHLTHQLLRRVVIGKEQRVADVVEGLAQNDESCGGGGEQPGQAVLRRESMVGCEREAATTHFLIVAEIR